jgi:S1-C subfamily serine protease
VVSSLGRTIDTEENRRLEGMIQTDAAINPGNSGGPLLDSHGSVIGINTAIYGQQGSIGIGFALPINRVKSMLEEFQQTGRISRPTLGIRTVYVAGDLADMLSLPQQGGLLIQSVERGSAAERAGLRGPSRTVVVSGFQMGIGGDLILAADGQNIEDNNSLPTLLNRKRGGDMIELTIHRNGRTQKVPVKLGEAPQQL